MFSNYTFTGVSIGSQSVTSSAATVVRSISISTAVSTAISIHSTFINITAGWEYVTKLQYYVHAQKNSLSIYRVHFPHTLATQLLHAVL